MHAMNAPLKNSSDLLICRKFSFAHRFKSALDGLSFVFGHAIDACLVRIGLA
jgi:hypothetical protein